MRVPQEICGEIAYWCDGETIVHMLMAGMTIPLTLLYKIKAKRIWYKYGKIQSLTHWLDRYPDLLKNEHKCQTVACLLFDQGADVHERDDYALRTASRWGHLEFVRLLLDRGADVGAHCEEPIKGASYYGRLKVVRLLLDRGANANAALLCASRGGHLETVKLLLDRATNIFYSLHYALAYASELGHFKVVCLLLERGANIRGPCNALRRAASAGHLEIVRLLLDRGADDIHVEGIRALTRAASRGHLEVVRLLLDRGAYLHADLDLALREVAGWDMICLLLDRGADLTARLQEGLYFLQDVGLRATKDNLERYVRWVLGDVFNVNVVEESGFLDLAICVVKKMMITRKAKMFYLDAINHGG